MDERKDVLALDPSTKCTGYCLMAGNGNILDAGRFRAPTEWPGWRRALSMADDLAALIDEIGPGRVIVEIPNNHAHGGGEDSKGFGLATYGVAVGAVLHVLWRSPLRELVYPVKPSEWAGESSKISRARQVAMLHPGYVDIADKDSGLDVADAIALAMFGLELDQATINTTLRNAGVTER